MRVIALSTTVGAVLILALLGSPLLAQDQPAAGSPPPGAASQAPPAGTQAQPAEPQASPAPNPGQQAPQPEAPERQAKRLAKRLALTPEQQSEVESILANRQQQVQNARANITLLPRFRRAEVQRINKESDKKIEAILTNPQKQQYQQMKQEQRAQRQERQQQLAGAPPTANN